MFPDSIMTLKLNYVLIRRPLILSKYIATQIYSVYFERVHLSLHDVYTVSYIDTDEF